MYQVQKLNQQTKAKQAVKRTQTALMYVLPFVLSVGILDPDWDRTDFGPEVQHLCPPGVASSCVPARTSRADCDRTLTCRYSPDSLTYNSTTDLKLAS